MKKRVLCLMMVLMGMLVTACESSGRSSDNPAKNQGVAEEEIVVGFSQLGAESDWRSANTESMKETFTRENGYQLIFEDGQQQQANQIMAIRTFIQQEVDYIVLAPVQETGWDTVLQEAKDAGIPVIIVDRMVDVSDDSLFTCWVGSDFELEGKKAAEWLNRYTMDRGIDPRSLNIVHIQGTRGASAQIGRTKGLTDAAQAYGWNLLAQVNGDFTREKGKEAMESLLEQFDDIQVVYCENDNEALGAIEAIEASGREVGSDIAGGQLMVISFDGVTKEIMNYVRRDKISFVAECNPLHGPRVDAIIKRLEAGESPEKFSCVEERIYANAKSADTVTVGETVYPVTRVTGDLTADWKK